MHTELEMMGEARRGHAGTFGPVNTHKSTLIYEVFLKKKKMETSLYMHSSFIHLHVLYLFKKQSDRY